MAGAALMLALASCSREQDMGNPGAVGDGETFVKFSIWLPGNSAPTTRALTESNENHVQTIDILIFEQGGAWVYNTGCSGSDIATDGGNPLKKSFTIKMRQGSYDMVMLANARSIVSGMNMSGQSKSVVLAALTAQMPPGGKWITDPAATGYKSIPMWGDVGNVTINSSTQNLDAQNIHLTRMLARVDVQIDPLVTNFILTSVDVYNYNTDGSLVPTAAGSWNGSKAVTPNVPSASTLTKGPLEYNNDSGKSEINTTANRCAMEIYLFEAENHTAGSHATAKDMLDRTCIVIGGEYGTDGKTTYYRADFSTSKDNTGNVLLDVLRNHHYTFEITKVSSSGAGSSEDAFKGVKNIEFEVQVIDWGDNVSVPLVPKPERWARSNIVWDAANSRLTFAVTESDNATIPANSQGVFFKWGSLVAVSPANYSYAPASILFSPNNNKAYAWTAIPYANETTGKWGNSDASEDDFAGYDGFTNTGGPGYATSGANINKGDICRYISDQPGWVEGKWRLPTADEMQALMAEATSVSNNGGFGNIVGTLTGNNSYGDYAHGFWQPESGRWLGAGAAADAARNNSAKVAELVPGPSSVYFPAGGRRNDTDGDAGNAGYYGYAWSASSDNTLNAYTLNVYSNNARRAGSSRSFGYPVRCIRDEEGSASGRPGAAPMLSTDYDGGGKKIPTDGGTYTVTVSSNTEWEAYVQRGTDKVTSGDGDVIGKPLLNETTGFGGTTPGAYISDEGNGMLSLTTVDYSGSGQDAQGDLTIVFRDKDSGLILDEVTITVKDPSIARRFARSNIVWDGSKLTFAVTAADNATIPANVQGVFFKWGSLVAVSPVGNTYAANQILFSPDGTTNYTWANIPYASETSGKFGTHGTDEDDFAGYDGGSNTNGPGFNASTNKGDICRYISDQGWVQGRWRLPTSAEQQVLINEATSVSNNGGFGNVTGAPTGNNSYGNYINGYWQPASGRWLGAGAAADAARNTGKAAELVPGSSSVYFPAGGVRNYSNGDTYFAGNYGSGWSGSSTNTTGAYYLGVSSGNASWNYDYFRTYGFPVRCVRE